MFAWTTMYFSPPERTKTGKFLEEFAQDADGCKVSSILQLPCYEHPPAPTTTKQSNIFRSRRGNSSRDEENPEEKGKSTKPKRDWIPERPIRLSYYRLRYPGAEEMILGIDDLPPDGAKNDTRSEGAKDLHWIEIRGWERGYMDLDPFRRFVATEHSYIPEQNRADISKWLESLDNDYSQEAFPGTRLPPMIKGFVSNSRSEGDNMRQLSCLFFCFPYFQLSIQGHFELSTIQKHSIRPLVQSFYRSKSPFDRELDQAARKFLKNDSKIIYVPQFWGLLINDDYLATYSPSQLHLRHGSRILTAPSSKFPSSFRLLLPKGPSFYVYWADCPTWFDFLSRVHSICSQVLENHVDPEQNAYRSVEQAEIIDANNWSKKAAEEREKIFEIEILDEFAQFRELLDGNQSRRRTTTKTSDANDTIIETIPQNPNFRRTITHAIP
ncbi:hypothetical protein GGR51DRAFT_437195 [Nemania sp. FL0031]|nr:hypothetical protein GGR51DRAFT_437195 [Nemania sp. FL0031]